MTTKQQIIQKIKQCNDRQLLEEINQWISAVIQEAEERSISKEEIRKVQEGYGQYQAGELMSVEEAQKQFEAWLKDK